MHRVHSVRLDSQADVYAPDHLGTASDYSPEIELESDSSIDDPLEFAENLRNPSTGTV